MFQSKRTSAQPTALVNLALVRCCRFVVEQAKRFRSHFQAMVAHHKTGNCALPQWKAFLLRIPENLTLEGRIGADASTLRLAMSSTLEQRHAAVFAVVGKAEC